MWPTKLAVISLCCFLFGQAAELETKPSPVGTPAETVATTKLTASIEEPKSKTEKRDSSDQTASIFTSKPAKESPFRPIYPATAYYEAAESGPIFEPTTVRYTAADAGAAQNYYEKPEIRYVPATAVEQKGGLPGPLQFAPQQQQQQQQEHHQQQHRFKFATPPQVELYQRPAAVKSPHNTIYSYVEAEPSIYERVAPQQYTYAVPQQQQQQQQQQQLPLPLSLPGHRIQYIIAIPLSYMRQLQQQLSGGLLPTASSTAPSTSSSTSSTTTSTTSTAAPPATAAAAASQSHMQLLGPLARDHHGVYRPYFQSDLAAAPSAVPTPIAAYGQHYLQIPANVLLAAAQQLQQHQQQQQQHQHQQQQQQQAVYAKATATPATFYQPLIYQQAKPQAPGPIHVQRIYQQAPTIYTEHPSQLYAYPLHQQHQQQQQQQGRLLRLGLKPADQQQHKYATATPSAAAAPASAVAAAVPTIATTTASLLLPTPAALHAKQQQQQQLPIVHYNPIYVQAPAEQQHHQLQHQQQQQHQFAILPRFSNNNPKTGYESTPPIHVVRLAAANALGHQQPQAIHQFHQYQPQPQQQQYYQSFADEQHLHQQQHQQHQQQQQSPSPAVIPYFSHPGAVHYGTHLYHPAAATTTTKQLQQQPRQAAAATATSGRLAGDNNAGAAAVKQAAAASNVVKYP